MPLAASGQRQILAREHYVCVLSPALAGPAQRMGMGMNQFLAMRHAVVDPAAGHSQLDELLDRLRITRRVALRIHHFSALPSIVESCGMMAIVPLGMARQLEARWDIAIRELPVEVPHFDVTLYWNRGRAGTGALGWFLGLVARALEAPA